MQLCGHRTARSQSLGLWFLAALFVFGAVALTRSAAASPPDRVFGASFEAISGLVHTVAENTGAPGAALILGTPDAVFYVETVGATDLTTPIVLPNKADLMQTALVFSLIDSGHLRPADPRLAPARSAPGTPRARNALVQTAEDAAGEPWAHLFHERLGKPMRLEDTHFTGAPQTGTDQSLPLTQTTTRDLARLGALLAGDGTHEGVDIVDAGTLAANLAPDAAGSDLCTDTDVSGTCRLIETAGLGLYAFVDRPRRIYGVLTAPGAETDLQEAGVLIRALAASITDRSMGQGIPEPLPAPAGLTAATN